MNFFKHRRWLSAWLFLALVCTGAAEGAPPVLFGDFAALQEMRRGWDRHQPSPQARAAVKAADALLGKKIVPITQKTETAASGDRHDYYSIGIYWWPNPLTGGKPYLRWDGQHNPESDRYDRPKLDAMAKETLALATAFAITGDPAYCAKAAEYLRVWFVDPETRMNPHLRYAQAWPGWKDGTAIGIIEGAAFARRTPDAIALLRQGGGLPDRDYEPIRRWFADFAAWLETSPSGREIDREENNLANWYDVQRVTYALFLGDQKQARALLLGVGPRRIAKQIGADGRQPAELKRTKAFDYSCYSLSALLTLCELGDRVGVDLWHYQAPEHGGSVRKALDFLLPFATREKPWPYPQLKGLRPWALAPLLLKAADHFPDAGYREIAEKLPSPAGLKGR